MACDTDRGTSPAPALALACPDSTAVPDAALRAAIADAVDTVTGDCAADLGRVRTLGARSRGVERLDGIAIVAAVDYVDLGDNAITDATPLSGLSRLASLNLEGNRLVDIAPLARLPALAFLILSFNRVEDLSPLLAAPALRSLEVTGNPLSEASVAQRGAFAAAGVAVEGIDTGPTSPDPEVPVLDGPPGPVAGLAFLRDRSQLDRTLAIDRGLFVLDPDDPEAPPRRLTADSVNVVPPAPAWSADGTRIAFVLSWKFRRYLVTVRADVADASVGECLAAEVASHANGFFGLSWSPDGRTFAFAANWTFDPELYVVGAREGSGGPQASLPLAPRSGVDGDPAWSPDGRRLAFASDRGGDGTQIWVMAPDGSDPVQLTVASGGSYGPAWSPDGGRIAFHSDRDGDAEIYVMRPDGSDLRRLTEDPATDFGSTWSPDGERIAFCSDRDGRSQVYAVPAGGGAALNLTRSDASDCWPAWSPVRRP